MRVVVIGSAGQLGRDLVPLLPGAVPLTRADADLTDPAALREALARLGPDAVVNCAAYNFVDKAESEPEAAFAVNTHAVRSLALICRDLGARLVQFSTDYVFGLDEDPGRPLTADDPPGPVSAYGLSKLAGEYAVRAASPDNLVVRTCGLYGVWGSGGKGGNFIETMLKLAAAGKSIKVVDDQHCTPSYTADVAAATAGLLATGARGIVHVTNTGDTTWHGLAAEAFQQSGVEADLSPTTAAAYGAPARRPAYSVLDNASLDRWGVPRPRPWREALSAYLAERQKRT